MRLLLLPPIFVIVCDPLRLAILHCFPCSLSPQPAPITRPPAPSTTPWTPSTPAPPTAPLLAFHQVSSSAPPPPLICRLFSFPYRLRNHPAAANTPTATPLPPHHHQQCCCRRRCRRRALVALNWWYSSSRRAVVRNEPPSAPTLGVSC
eukprot:6213345-Pleurochrysis_carterae.AAC.1